MERESNPMETLCRSGCGFYGNPSTDGLCSVCFKEALKKKQQPPSSAPSAVSSFVPAPAPAPAPATPLAAAAPTVPSLPATPHHIIDSKCPTCTKQKNTIMENDPSKKDSKGRRLFKKAIRRSSKSNNGSQSSALEQGMSVSRSKSFENKNQALEINDSTPLPTPDGPTEKPEHASATQKLKIDDRLHAQGLTIPEPLSDNANSTLASQIEDHDRLPIGSRDTAKLTLTFDQTEPESSRKSLKRKLEEESGAGTSGTSTGASDTDADDKDPSKDKKKKNRCAVCRKKVGLTGFECRCGGLFCAVHRYSDKHECSFDYRELGAQEIRRNNPVVVSQKIHKI